MIVRPAKQGDMPSVHLMAHDTWGEGRTRDEHVALCLTLPKYAKGRWFVLEINGAPVSSLICYRNAFGLPENIMGIGSVATTPASRKKGLASFLTTEVMERLSEDDGIDGFFLYSDVNPSMYEKLGFVKLPKDMQRYERSAAMIRPVKKSLRLLVGGDFKVPDYF